LAGLKIAAVKDGIRFAVRVVPGSSKTAFAGVLNGMLKVKIAAPPEKGKANECLVEFLSDKLESAEKRHNNNFRAYQPR